ncbi:MAG: divergent PAP2 family protein [bacterium]
MIIENNGLEVITAAIIAAFMAQFLKIVFYYKTNKKINFKILTETGGMPSSHSAFVIALTTSVALVEGYLSTQFAIALGYALVVMYDAAGLRRSAGKMATVLNKVVDDYYHEKPTKPSERLIELLGHTPIEVLMGALLGFVISMAYHVILCKF